MTTLSNVQHNIVRGINRTALLGKKHSPEILLGLGLVGVVASAVLAAKATLKVNEVVVEAKETVYQIKLAGERGMIGDTEKGRLYSKDDHDKDLAVAYVQTGLKFAKLYGPSVGLGVLSMASILASHGLMKRREVGLIAGYNLIAESFSSYRKRVVEELGPEIDKNYRHGIYETEFTDKEVGEDGIVTKTKKKQKNMAKRTVSGFAKFFDEYSTQYQPNAENNLYFLRLQQNHANDMLRVRGHVYLNEVYDMLGLPRTREGGIYGWIMNGDGTTNIDFGIYNIDNPSGRSFVNGYEKAILLDFNVSGIMWDQI